MCRSTTTGVGKALGVKVTIEEVAEATQASYFQNWQSPVLKGVR